MCYKPDLEDSLEKYVKKFQVKAGIRRNSFYEEPEDSEVIFDMVPSRESTERIGLSHLTYKSN